MKDWRRKSKVGLVIGKFYPPHLGHLQLVDFGIESELCDQLIVAVCSRPEETIPPQLRVQWLREIYVSQPLVKIASIKADLPQEKVASRPASYVWAQYLMQRFGRIDYIFSSEKYGDYLAEYMNCEHISFDRDRSVVPISATMVREKPLSNWKMIPEVVRPYFVKRICVTGTESTGKSTLAEQLAEHYETVWVHEYGRDYCAAQGNVWGYRDITPIALGHVQLEEAAAQKANKVMFSDTDQIITSVFCRDRYHRVPKTVKEIANQKRHDLHLFCDIDLPWEKDDQRELGHCREEMKQILVAELEKRGRPYVMVTGCGKARLRCAIKAVDKFLAQF